MYFTEEDIPLMKLIFNPSTHDMGMMVGRKRAEDIFEFVCNEIVRDKKNFIKNVSDFFERILRKEKFCDFFWDNNILQLSFLNPFDIAYILSCSPIAEKIWDSDKLDLSKLETFDIYWILENSSIAEKIWDSRKLNVSLLSEEQLDYFKQKFEK